MLREREAAHSVPENDPLTVDSSFFLQKSKLKSVGEFGPTADA
jgi:hypothetical protein